MVWVAEYSQAQGCFHIETIDRVLALNQEAVLKGRNPGYIPLGFFRSYDEAHSFTEEFASRMKCDRRMMERREEMIKQLRDGTE